MAGEIFISYRRADQAWARLLHSQLMAEGIEAWYDGLVGPGQEWRTATAKALEASQIFVLLFSENAAQSSDIVKELAAATHEKKLVVPVRLQDIEPKGAFLYELASRNWVNAYEDTEARLGELAKGLARMVRTGARDENALWLKQAPERNAKPALRGMAGSRSVLALAAMAALVLLLAGLYWRHPGAALSPSRAASATPAAAAIPAKAAGTSVAVLPFLNMSADKDQDYFSDGMTEEITSALAKVPGLTVIGRTSAFQFKGENRDMRAIGKALGVNNLIEGSVRKEGDEVRISAQLVRVADGVELWTETYDRKLKGIFAVQEDIAAAIAHAMQVPLGLRQTQNLVANRTDDLGAYQQYLEARALYRARRIDEATARLQRVVARDPKYAPAWALLASAYLIPAQLDKVGAPFVAGSLDIGEARLRIQSIFQRAEQAAREAIRLDPNNAMGYHALGNLESIRGNLIASEDDRRKALALDPNDSDILYGYASFLADVGRLKDARRIQSEILAQEPFVPNYNRQAADVLWAQGQNDAAIAALEQLSLNADRNFVLARAYATAGDYAKAADTILAIPPSSPYPRETLESAARLLRSARTGGDRSDTISQSALIFVYLFIGTGEGILDFSERRMEIGLYGALFRLPWGPPAQLLRKTQHFKAYARKSGFVQYWRARGWPEFCHPIGADDFACT